MASKAHLIALTAAILTPAHSQAATGEHVCGRFDHSHLRWGAVLAAHVKDGVVDYAGLRADPSGLADYLQELESVCADGFAVWSHDQKVAFWINAYNGRWWAWR